MGKVAGWVCLIILIFIVGFWFAGVSRTGDEQRATASVAVATAQAVAGTSTPTAAPAPTATRPSSTNTPQAQAAAATSQTLSGNRPTTAPVADKGTATCTNGAIVQLADDGNIWMPNGNPVPSFDCDISLSQSYINLAQNGQRYWKGVNAELSIAGSGVLIPVKSANKWIELKAGTTYHIHGGAGNGGFALQTYES